MEVIAWIIGIIFAVGIAIQLWPITLIVIICFIVYYIKRKNKREECENSIAYYKERINSSQKKIGDHQKRLQMCETRVNTTDIQLQDTRKKLTEISRDVQFFSSLFKSSSIAMPRCIEDLDKTISMLEQTKSLALDEVNKLQQEIKRESQNLSSYNSSLSTLNSELQSLTAKK